MLFQTGYLGTMGHYHQRWSLVQSNEGQDQYPLEKAIVSFTTYHMPMVSVALNNNVLLLHLNAV